MEGVISNKPTPSDDLPVERLNSAVQHQLNLEHVRARAINLFKAISRMLEDFDTYARTNTNPNWQDILGQYSMVNLELFTIIEDIRKVSNAFVVHPKNVNAENATILPVMLSSKLLPEMEMDDNSKKEQLLQGMQNLPVALQIDKLKTRIDMIAAACESAEKVLSDTRKAYGFGGRQAPTITPTLDKPQADKIQKQENLLRAAVNHGEGMYHKNSPMQPSNIASQNILLQASRAQLIGRSVASPSPAASLDTATASPLPYASSPRSGTNMNARSPQQQTLQQQQQQQQRQQMMQLPQHQQQLLAQQQYRQSAMSNLGQFGLAGTNPQRTHPSQTLNDQANPTGMMSMQPHENMQQNP